MPSLPHAPLNRAQPTLAPAPAGPPSCAAQLHFRPGSAPGPVPRPLSLGCPRGRPNARGRGYRTSCLVAAPWNQRSSLSLPFFPPCFPMTRFLSPMLETALRPFSPLPKSPANPLPCPRGAGKFLSTQLLPARPTAGVPARPPGPRSLPLCAAMASPPRRPACAMHAVASPVADVQPCPTPSSSSRRLHLPCVSARLFFMRSPLPVRLGWAHVASPPRQQAHAVARRIAGVARGVQLAWRPASAARLARPSRTSARPAARGQAVLWRGSCVCPQCGLVLAFGTTCVWLACPRLARVCPTQPRAHRA
jgi:hypothetical protein